MSNTQKASSVAIFERVARRVIARFAYLADSKAYGETDLWRPCREVNDRLVGDCEDFCITIAEECDRAGVPAEDLTLYLVAVERSPDHVVIGCGEWIADCNEGGLLTKTGRHYFRWVSERVLSSPEWVRSQ